ncbi:hypothetical protein L798_12968 [Zootermopsis nevadensis]|uniref:Uncharacterized protein n=1 Tax=Zootermopsis nevadensis TaxID=136037 RepID=A0A067R558_ZOONE|nr:hypothetical protein L798_12968 [Zootermopsis nevadensis]
MQSSVIVKMMVFYRVAVWFFSSGRLGLYFKNVIEYIKTINSYMLNNKVIKIWQVFKRLNVADHQLTCCRGKCVQSGQCGHVCDLIGHTRHLIRKR